MQNIVSTLRTSAQAINATLKGTTSNAVPIIAGAFIPTVRPGTAFRLLKESPKVLVTGTLRSFGVGIAIDVAYLELADLIGAGVNERRRRRELSQLLDDFVVELSPEQLAEVKRLNRKPERRTFYQFIRDIPSDAFRRVARAAYVEAGWWVMVLTSPVWLTAAILGTAYTWLVVLPLHAAIQVIFEKTIDLDKWMKPSIFAKKAIRHTLGRGWRMMGKGFSMKIYDTNKIHLNDEAFDALDLHSAEAYKTVSKIVDRQTAFAWGERLAELIAEDDRLAAEDKVKAYGQSTFWIDAKITPEFRSAVKGGFRAGTPLVHRSLVLV